MANILVIDDEPSIRTLLRSVLELAGHQVLEAADGAEGVKAFRAQPADVVFCDLIMPGQGGLDTIQELRQDFPAVKIIAMSGKLDLLADAKLRGADAALDKPFGRQQILDALTLVLGSG